MATMTEGSRPARVSPRAGRRRGLLSVLISLFPFVLMAAAWQAIYALHVFPPILFPSLQSIFSSMWELAASRVLFVHIGITIFRLGLGFLIGVAVGVLAGFVMGRSALVERMLQPVFTVLMPVPALAWQPLFILWFGIGNKPTIILVAFSSGLVVAFNTWSGVKTIDPVLIRAARSMNIDGFALARKVILPGAIPGIITGLRLGIAQAWRAVVAGEMIAGTSFGLGFLIFNAQEFINTKVMLGSITIIALLGLAIERYTFGLLEKKTAVRWGTVTQLDGGSAR
jgi:NitT/TauT family transport system permease protein